MQKPLLIGAGLSLMAMLGISPAVPLQLHTKAWTDVGRIMHSTDTLQTNFNGDWQQTMGLQLNGIATLGENLEGGFGFGINQVYHSLGNPDQEKFTLSKFVNFVSEAQITYSIGEKAKPVLSASVGNFKFNYNSSVKNLGLYLFRGPVYPGFLVSGLKESRTDTTRASFLGVHLQNTIRNFRHDLIFSSERDLPPSFDWSLGYVARYKPLSAIELGAGVNFYHLIPQNSNLTTPNQVGFPGLYSKDSALVASGAKLTPYQLQYIEVLSTGETVVYTHQGTKLMAMFNIDFKSVFGLNAPFGDKDLVLYGEGALIGTKNYGSIYAKRSERMPFMVGLNLPTFGVLDFFSLEVERYTAKYKADYSKLGYDHSLYFKNIAPPQLLARKEPSAIPISLGDLAGNRYSITPAGNFVEIQTGDTILVKGTELDPENLTADDWKWSLNFEKTLVQHVQFSGQIANDHLIPRPVRGGLITESSGLSQVFSSMKDWYVMFRIGYFF